MRDTCLSKGTAKLIHLLQCSHARLPPAIRHAMQLAHRAILEKRSVQRRIKVCECVSLPYHHSYFSLATIDKLYALIALHLSSRHAVLATHYGWDSTIWTTV